MKETEDVEMAENCRRGFLVSVLSEFREGEEVESNSRDKKNKVKKQEKLLCSRLAMRCGM